MRTLLTATLMSHVIDEPKALGGRTWRTMRDLVRDSDSVEELVLRSQERLSPPDKEIMMARLELLDAMEMRLARFEAEGIEVVTEFDDDYPRRLIERLNGKHPAMFFVAGARSLMNAESIGVVGSRDVDDEGKAFARAVAAEAVAHTRAIVSGGARGVDLESMRAALDEGGKTIGFLADSMDKLVRRPQMREFLTEGRACLATSFTPSAGFQVGNAMARNKFIYAHSLATVVVSCATGTGGTWTGAIEAMKMNLCPVLVRQGPDATDGNMELVKRGAKPIAAPEEIWENLAHTEVAKQESLFGNRPC